MVDPKFDLGELFVSRFLYYFEMNTKTVTKLDLEAKELLTIDLGVSQELGPYSAQCKIPNERVFMCGGNTGISYSGATLIFNPETDQVQELVPLELPRQFACCVYFENKVYLFGGYNDDQAQGELEDCAKLDLTSNSWIRIANLPTKCKHTTSVVFKGLIFVTGYEASGIWVYDPYRDFFDLVMHLCKGFKVLCRSQSKLFCLTEKCLYEMQENGVFFKVLKRRFALSSLVTHPFCYGSSIYFIDSDENLCFLNHSSYCFEIQKVRPSTLITE